MSEVLLGVVDHPVGPQRPDHLHIGGAAHPGDRGPEVLGQLHRIGAHTPGSAVDQDVLPTLDIGLPEEPQGRDPPGGEPGGGLLEGHVGRLEGEHAVLLG